MLTLRRKKYLIKIASLSLLLALVVCLYRLTPDVIETTMNIESEGLSVNHLMEQDSIHSLGDMEQNIDVFRNILQMSKNKNTLLYGHRKSTEEGFLTIGIPSVSRPEGHAYLVETLRSVIKNADPSKNNDVTIVVFMADTNDDWNLVTAKKLHTIFKHFCDTGFLQIIHAPGKIYPKTKSFGTLPTNEGSLRTNWRTKQNIDFAFLMIYSKSISKYYLQLEDDVESASHFVHAIRVSVNNTNNWICLEYSKLGFIGKLFNSKYLGRISYFLATHFDTKPCDILLGYILKILGQVKANHMKSLFQHTGKWSSLLGKLYPAIDTSFKDIGLKPLAILDIPKGDNPKAILETDMAAKPGYGPNHAYNGSSSYFYTQLARKGNYFHIMYAKQINCSRVVISTGDTMRHDGLLKHGNLQACLDHLCTKRFHMAKFIEGEFDTQISHITIPRNVYGFVVTITSTQSVFIIRKISIFLGKQII